MKMVRCSFICKGSKKKVVQIYFSQQVTPLLWAAPVLLPTSYS